MSELNIINEINKQNWKETWLNFSVYLYEKCRLVIVGSDELTYYHKIEIIVELPSYISGVMDWSCDRDDEFIRVRTQTGNPCQKYILEFYADDELKFKVIADEIKLNFDTVFYYKRENLKTGERLAYWVK
jgi:hypothetical protein